MSGTARAYHSSASDHRPEPIHASATFPSSMARVAQPAPSVRAIWAPDSARCSASANSPSLRRMSDAFV